MPEGIPQPCVSPVLRCSLSKYPVLFGIWAIPKWPNNSIAVPSNTILGIFTFNTPDYSRPLPFRTTTNTRLQGTFPLHRLTFYFYKRHTEALLHVSIICRKPRRSQMAALSLDIDCTRNLRFQESLHSLIPPSRWAISRRALPCL